MKTLLAAVFLLHLVGCASSQPSTVRESRCEEIETKTIKSLANPVKIRAVSNHEQTAIYLHEERLKVGAAAGLDRCIASYELDLGISPLVISPAIQKDTQGAPHSATHSFFRLRNELDADLKKALRDYRRAWIELLDTMIQAKRDQYKFELVDKCKIEADSMSRTIMSSIGNSNFSSLNSPVYLLYSKCVNE